MIYVFYCHLPNR